MATGKQGPKLQPYPRTDGGSLLAKSSLFPRLSPPIKTNVLERSIDAAFSRCALKKSGKSKEIPDNPEKLVELCIEHLRTRSDPIVSPHFLSQCDIEDLFEFDAVSHEMQRHRMTIGVFYQYLLLELMKCRWQVFDGYHEGDIIADVDTPEFPGGLRLYMSVKKSADTVGGQDVGGVVSRLESMAKQEKNLSRPYLCVFCVATPTGGRLWSFEKDRHIRCKIDGRPYSLNCEFWGPGFVFPYVTGRSAKEIYWLGVRRVASHLPFLTLTYRKECSALLKKKLNDLGLLNQSGKIDPEKFLNFCCREST
jgi:hypothetical protein